jgi:hypothetical protein
VVLEAARAAVERAAHLYANTSFGAHP